MGFRTTPQYRSCPLLLQIYLIICCLFDIVLWITNCAAALYGTFLLQINIYRHYREGFLGVLRLTAITSSIVAIANTVLLTAAFALALINKYCDKAHNKFDALLVFAGVVMVAGMYNGLSVSRYGFGDFGTLGTTLLSIPSSQSLCCIHDIIPENLTNAYNCLCNFTLECSSHSRDFFSECTTEALHRFTVYGTILQIMQITAFAAAAFFLVMGGVVTISYLITERHRVQIEGVEVKTYSQLRRIHDEEKAAKRQLKKDRDESDDKSKKKKVKIQRTALYQATQQKELPRQGSRSS